MLCSLFLCSCQCCSEMILLTCNEDLWKRKVEIHDGIMAVEIHHGSFVVIWWPTAMVDIDVYHISHSSNGLQMLHKSRPDPHPPSNVSYYFKHFSLDKEVTTICRCPCRSSSRLNRSFNQEVKMMSDLLKQETSV